MPSISNLVSAPAPAIETVQAVAPATAAAPASRFGKVTCHDERTATVVDNKGRSIKVKKLSALDRVRLFKAAGATHSENRMLQSYYSTAASVTDLDGMPVVFPISEMQLDALVARLDEHGLEAAILGLLALAPATQDVATEAKGF
jgi:hypothetical protein